MRLLRFDFPATYEKFDFHPLVTVINHSNVDKQIYLLNALRNMAAGNYRNISALVENSGVLVEIDKTNIPSIRPFKTKQDVVIYLGNDALSSQLGLFRSELTITEKNLEIAAVRLEELRSNLNFGIRAEVYSVKKRFSEINSDIKLDKNSKQIFSEVESLVQSAESLAANKSQLPPEFEDLHSRVEKFYSDKSDTEKFVSEESNSNLLTVEQEELKLRSEVEDIIGSETSHNLLDDIDSLKNNIENPEILHIVKQIKVLLNKCNINPPKDLNTEDLLKWVKSNVNPDSCLNRRKKKTEIDNLNNKILDLEADMHRHYQALMKIARVESDYIQAVLKLDRIKQTLEKQLEESSQLTVSLVENELFNLAAKILEEANNSLPIVLVTEFDGINSENICDLLKSIEILSKDIQILIITKRKEVISYFENVSPESAMLIGEKTKVR